MPVIKCELARDARSERKAPPLRPLPTLLSFPSASSANGLKFCSTSVIVRTGRRAASCVLQPWDEADDKDRVEACLARAFCAGKIILDEARLRIWREVGKACR